tara:strand:+ start:838 stop:1314 length:477 start_codon:yes stop_codon:yes gene_type:complete
MFWVDYNIKGAKSIINRWKQGAFWDEIAEEALDEVSDDIESSVKTAIEMTNLKTHTGRLKDSISVGVIGSELYVASDHPAMGLVEYGGYRGFPNPKSATIKEYESIYGQSGYVIARGIFRNQPYAEGRFPIYKGVERALEGGRLNKITYRIAKERSGN